MKTANLNIAEGPTQLQKFYGKNTFKNRPKKQTEKLKTLIPLIYIFT